jgi:hypothetical protein
MRVVGSCFLAVALVATVEVIGACAEDLPGVEGSSPYSGPRTALFLANVGFTIINGVTLATNDNHVIPALIGLSTSLAAMMLEPSSGDSYGAFFGAAVASLTVSVASLVMLGEDRQRDRGTQSDRESIQPEVRLCGDDIRVDLVWHSTF